MDLNRFGLDTMLVSGLESEINHEDITTNTQSITEEELGNEIAELVAANESLDRMMHAGLTDGMESVVDTLKLIQLSDALHTMDAIAAGTEEYNSNMEGLESALRYAGVDLSELAGYEAGTEAREGGIVQPLRSAGASIKGSKAYQAVSNSWVGKTAGKIGATIARIWNWIKEFIFGKKAKVASNNVNKVLANQKKKFSEVLATSMREKDEAIASLKTALDNMNKQYIEESESHVECFQLAKQLEKEKKEMAAFIKKIQGKARAGAFYRQKLKADLEKNRQELADTKSQLQGVEPELDQPKQNLEDTQMQKNNIIKQYLLEYAELAGRAEATKQLMEKYNIVPAMDKFVKNNQTNSSSNGNSDPKGINRKFEFRKTISSILGSMGYCSKETIYAAQIFKQWLSTPGREVFDKYNFEKSIRVPATLSEEVDISKLVGFDTGIESEEFKDEEPEVGGLESVAISEMIAAWDVMMAIEAGIECMNIDIFGHPYTGIDMESKTVIAFTNRDEYGEAGTEAEETAKEEKPSETAATEGFFTSAGTKAKKAGKWMRVKGRQFWKWIKSKLGILAPMMDRLAMITSKSFDLSVLNENELGNALAGIDSNLEKVAKLLDKNHSEETKSADDYIKDLAEAKKKVSSASRVSALRLMGAGNLLKKLRKVTNAVNKMDDNKDTNTAEVTKIMTEINRAIFGFNREVRKAIKNVKKASDATKDLDKSEEK